MALGWDRSPDPIKSNKKKDAKTHTALFVLLQRKAIRDRGIFVFHIPHVASQTQSPQVGTHQTHHCCPHCSLQALSSLQLSWEPGFPGTSWIGQQKVGGLNYRDLFKKDSVMVLMYM